MLSLSVRQWYKKAALKGRTCGGVNCGSSSSKRQQKAERRPVLNGGVGAEATSSLSLAVGLKDFKSTKGDRF